MLTALVSMGVQWPSLESALLASPGFEVELVEAAVHEEAIFEFDTDDFDEDDDFDESGVEVIYVRD
jgi:hypothetical protein